MVGFWLVSYIVLWLVVLALGVVVVGNLQQIGQIQWHLRKHPSADRGAGVPSVAEDGPPIGSLLPETLAAKLTHHPTTASAPADRSILLMCLSALCDSCHVVVEPLNRVMEEQEHAVQVVSIIRGPEQTCSTFQKVFSLRTPVVCDPDREVTMGLEVHRNPFGLLYDAHGTLVRKGAVEGYEDLLALLGDASVSATARSHVFPPLDTVETLAEAAS